MSDNKQLIECTAGATETSVGGTGYRFERDHYGRFVSEVHNLVHRACLLSVVHYRAVPDTPLIEETAPGLGDDGLRLDGPTVEEYVAAGYQAANYPPNGYAARSTVEEIEAAIAAQSAPADDMLLGSSILPSLVEIAEGKSVQLGEVVTRAYADSGLTRAAWNALPDDMREAALAATVEAMKAEAQQQRSKRQR
ncbi:hypothetical protein PBC5_gp09 [Sinorhizobium phage PBC5]|uniref:hypothetical protein n=1 Tax=Sinorhizobium phage PBC5 TaxID=179237 RepID=UPI001BE81118|nr:hypothetical protein PBC5_gp09 [Sinorhizobium phage PBC5]